MKTKLSIPLDYDVFESVDDCLNFLAKETTEPRLYRGESRFYPKTLPGTERILMDHSLHFQERTYRIGFVEHFEEWCCKPTNPLSVETGHMFLQHYGIPTGLLDFSSDPEIAIFFASLRHPEKLGLICSMDKQKASENGDLFNLQNYTIAPELQLERPKKQKAFALRHHPGLPLDLKSREARGMFGIKWYAFRKIGYEKYLEKYKHILEVDNDRAALYILACVADFGLRWPQADIGITTLRKMLKQMYL